ncbi:Exonuclease 1, partial [Stegodyphus mimosarum]
MDSAGGGLLYEKENLPKSFGVNAIKFSFEKFRYMCILSGCDYLPSLPGIGLAKACKFFMLTNNTDLSVVLSKLPSYLKMPKLVVSDEYKESFLKANNTFLYQLVFCPQKKSLVPLNPYPEGVDPKDMEYAGKYLPEDLAYQLAMGNINVKTFKEFANAQTDTQDPNDEKSAVWGAKENSKNIKLPQKKVVNVAFKFNSSEVKPAPNKRKHEQIATDNESPVINEDDDIFAMYGRDVQQKTSINSSSDEEPTSFNMKKPKVDDSSPLKVDENVSSNILNNVSNHQLQRIVRSRFFVTSDEQIDGQSRAESELNNQEKDKILQVSNELECFTSAPAFNENTEKESH